MALAVVFDETVRESDARLALATVAHVVAGTGQDDVEVHAVDADRGIVL